MDFITISKSSVVFIASFINLLVIIKSNVSPTLSCINNEKLCLGLPNGCASKEKFECTSLVTISAFEKGLHVDIYAAIIPGAYYSVGFGPERTMDGLFVDTCEYTLDDEIEMVEGYARGHEFTYLKAGALTESRSSQEFEDWIHCYFKQKAKTTVYGRTFNIKDRYYIALALGKLRNGWMKHHATRAISAGQVDFKSTGIIDLDVFRSHRNSSKGANCPTFSRERVTPNILQ